MDYLATSQVTGHGLKALTAEVLKKEAGEKSLKQWQTEAMNNIL